MDRVILYVTETKNKKRTEALSKILPLLTHVGLNSNNNYFRVTCHHTKKQASSNTTEFSNMPTVGLFIRIVLGLSSRNCERKFPCHRYPWFLGGCLW